MKDKSFKPVFVPFLRNSASQNRHKLPKKELVIIMQINVLEYLDNAAESAPDKLVFTDDSTELTYSVFRDMARRLGGTVAGLTERVNIPVAVLVDRNVMSLVGLMGVLYAGCYYVPIDKSMPAVRMEKVLDNLAPSLILYCRGDEGIARQFEASYPTAAIEDGAASELDDGLLERLRAEVLDVDPVYVIYTSGSTGTPKGIVISHRSVIDFTDWMADVCGINADNVMGNQAPFYFDASVKDIYLTLKCAATTHILSRKLFMFPVLLMDYLQKRQVNTLIWATSGFNLVANSGVLRDHAPKSVKKLAIGGEAMLAKHLNEWRRALPDAQYINLYGPTEVTVDCTYHLVDREYQDHEAIPIGKACRNKQVTLLDKDMCPVERGVPGEICVRGAGLAKGYYNDEEKTAAVFVQNPWVKYPDIIYKTGDIGVENDNGDIVFQSRVDGQIKHMGYRIELGEVERAVVSHEAVKAAVCFYDIEAGRIICVYEGGCESPDIITHIKKLIPKYMFPNIFKKLETMPFNANGKLDRPLIREIFNAENK